jgi:uncharacterized protein YndB with AHSA1/START domain
MTTPSRPLRFEYSIEVPGSPEQVWDAIATANGISAWMIPTEMDERAGGTVVFRMGPDMDSKGTVTGYDAPRRLVYEEPDWAALAGQDPTTVTPLVSEFLVEAQSGGTCVVRVVSSAFGSGADWEREFFADMEKAWTPMFEHLRLYLTHFPGQRVTSLEAGTELPGTADDTLRAMRRAVGAESAGQHVEVRGATAVVERADEVSVVLRVTDPVPGLLAFSAFASGETTSVARIAGYLFSDDAPEYVEREQPGWQAWIEGVAAEATQP